MQKRELILEPPIINAAGTLGFIPDLDGPISHLGAFITNPISDRPRVPAQEPRVWDFPGGFMLHTGHPNPGLAGAIRRYAKRWEKVTFPVIVHLLVEDPDQTARMVARLEVQEGVAAIELGLPPDIPAEMAVEIAHAARGGLPIIIRLPLLRAAALGPKVYAPGITALSLGPPRGCLPGSNAGVTNGRLYGPAIFPLAVHVLQTMLRLGAPIIGAGGIYQQHEIEQLLAMGAWAVQIDSALWDPNWLPGDQLDQGALK